MTRMVTKRRYMDFVLTAALCLSAVTFTDPQSLQAETLYPISYSGRLTLPGGEPMQGPVDIELRFWNASSGGGALSDPFPFSDVTLNQGVFQVRIPTTSDDIATVFGDGSKTVFIEVSANGVTYPRQEFTFVPLALRVPIDKSTVDFSTDGKLKVVLPARTSSDTVLSVDAQGKFAWEPLAVSNLQTKPVSQQAPTSGQVLTYDGSQWIPKTVTQGGSGTLSYTPLNKSGDTLAGSLNAGGYDITTTGNIQMAATKTFGLSANATDPTIGLTAADKGKTWFNSASGQIKYWDGLNALALAVAGTGISNVTQGTGITVANTSGTATVTLANTTVNAGSYSRANITVDAQGRLTGAVSAAAITDADVAPNAAIDPSKIAGLTTTLSGKQNTIAAGTSSQYWRGDKSWQELTTAAVSESGTSIYFNDARARGVLSATAPATYSLTSGAIGMTQSGNGADGYLSSTDWNTFNAKQNALGYTPLNKAGDSLSGVLNGGGFDITNTGNIQLAAAKTLGFGVFATDPTGLTVNDKGKIWFNSTTLQVKYWDGSSAVALGVSGSGLSSLNGQTGNTQTFPPPGTTGTAPAWSSASNAHTLNIPLASAANVTAGLLSNADYTSFANKVGSVTQGNGISVATANGTATVSLATTGTAGTYALVTTDTYGRVISGTTLSAGDIPPLNASAITSGMLPVGNGGTGAASLAAGNVVLGNGANAVQTVAPGTNGNVLTSNGSTWQSVALPATNWAAPGTIGSTTASSGDFTSVTSNAQAGYKAKPFGSSIGETGEIQFAELSANGTNYVGFKAPDVIGANKVWVLPSTDGTPGQVLKTDGAGNLGWSSDGGGTVTNVTVTAPLAVTNGTSVPAISLSQANGSTNGYLASTDWTTFNNKQATGNYVTTLSGDVTTTGFSSGTVSSALTSIALGGTVTKVTYDVKGRVNSGTTLDASDLPPHSASLINSGAIAVANGGTGLSSTPSNGQIPIGNGTGYSLGTLTAGTGISITNAAGAVTLSSTVDTSTKVNRQGDTMSGGLTLPANSLVAGTNQLVLAGGNVGIGTTAPAQKLSVSGVIESTSGGIKFPDGTTQATAASGSQWTTSGGDIYRSSGKVGIGATNPAMPLHVSTSTAGDMVRFENTLAGGNAVVQLFTNGGGSAYFGQVNGTWNGVSGSPLVFQSTGPVVFSSPLNTPRITLNTFGNVGIGTTAPTNSLQVYNSTQASIAVTGQGGTQGLYLGADSNQPWLGSSTNSDLRLVTNATEKVRITSTGNVGIGTTAPSANLSVIGSNTATLHLQAATHVGSGDNSTIILNAGGASWGSTPTVKLTGQDDGASGGIFNIYTNNTKRMSVLHNGNVGIGTTAPSQALTVNGKVASSNLRQLVSANNEVTTTSTTAVDMPNMSMTVTGSGLPVTMIASLSGIYFDTSGYAVYIFLLVDGSEVTRCVISPGAIGAKHSCGLSTIQTLSAGSHTIKLQWMMQGPGTVGVSWGPSQRSILVFE